MGGLTDMRRELLPVTRLVDQDMINQYATVSDDFNPVHVDPEFAAASPLGRTIAHGTLSLNLVWEALMKTHKEVDWSGVSIDVRFVRPVFVGDRITSGGVRRPDGEYDVWILNQDDDPVISGTLRGRFE